MLNDWPKEKIVLKDNIKEFQFLKDNGYIQEIDSNYYCLTCKFEDVVLKYYNLVNEKLAFELGIVDVGIEIKKFIKQLNEYNEIKDICQSLIGKLAEQKQVTTKEIHEELDLEI